MKLPKQFNQGKPQKKVTGSVIRCSEDAIKMRMGPDKDNNPKANSTGTYQSCEDATPIPPSEETHTPQ